MFTLIFREWFIGGLDQETVIGEQGSCFTSETRIIKERLDVTDLRVKVDGHRRVAQPSVDTRMPDEGHV